MNDAEIIIAIRREIASEIAHGLDLIDNALKSAAIGIASARERVPSAITDGTPVKIDIVAAANIVDDGCDKLNALAFVAGELDRISREGAPLAEAVRTLLAFGDCVRKMRRMGEAKALSERLRSEFRTAFGAGEEGNKD